MSEPECTCYPSGFTPETYEGPMPWCNAHSDAASGYEQGYLDGQRGQLDLCRAGLCEGAERARREAAP